MSIILRASRLYSYALDSLCIQRHYGIGGWHMTLSKELLLEAYHKMRTIRDFEENIHRENKYRILDLPLLNPTLYDRYLIIIDLELICFSIFGEGL